MIRALVTATMAAAAAGAILTAPLAGAAPNANGANHANEHAAKGIARASAGGGGGSVASATGNGPGPVLAAVAAKAPAQAQPGLAKAACRAAQVCPTDPAPEDDATS
ncbi:hypothetical protein MJO55_13265 [Mycolicibacterium rufum]|uniref:Uncharacterized protein n=1 Tax=Mycolicibacterium rufum TaxID=318424 RepID=A0A9X3BT97_9MYCO|nr:hypothetical protein [Mycolicibacterium rufum]KGI68244.1 hypothetical protein EU78_13320 [Mycolicibacterium rufum]MCV7073136.1 hypothetical protein [Mycolicibacterium rufum]ULP39285.1 hypothetical protein MJO55_13265 [Mycolicibacterium rufum]